MSALLARARARKSGATVFACHVDQLEAYGVVTLDEKADPCVWWKSPGRRRVPGQ